MTAKFHPGTLSAKLLVCGAVLATAAAAHGALQSRETTRPPRPDPRAISLDDEDKNLARNAWHYFEMNRQATGLVSSAAGFPATTMWDTGSQLAGMTAARELGLVSVPDFDGWMGKALESLALIPLYNNELPNKAYNAATLMPTGYGEVTTRREIGFSALDLARIVTWLDIVAARYPDHAEKCHLVTKRWNLERLTRDGHLMGTDRDARGETWNQEGRLGYEQYAAAGLAKIGVHAPVARDAHQNAVFVTVEGVAIPADRRDMHDSVAHNYVTSEPYVLDGLETGFRALPSEYAGAVLLAQSRRSRRTGELTAWSEDNLDKAPWFVYNTVYVDGEAWKTVDSSGRDASRFRGGSLKAAIGWHVLFRTVDTERVYKGLRWISDPERGVLAGYYEETHLPNAALTLNTNGIVLEALLYARVGRALESWAHGR